MSAPVVVVKVSLDLGLGAFFCFETSPHCEMVPRKGNDSRTVVSSPFGHALCVRACVRLSHPQ